MFTLPLAFEVTLGINDLFFGLLFILIIILIGSSTKAKFSTGVNNDHYKYYMLNIYFKMLLALLYGAIYLFYYQGGDTVAYYLGAECLNNLMWESPIDYWYELIQTPEVDHLIIRYNASTTGIPPGWIYRDPNSFFVSKIISVFMIFCGQSYVIITLFLAYLSSIASWKIFELVKSYAIASDGLAALSILFVPSVAFWCSGISKDTIVLISVFFLLHHTFALANKNAKSRFKSICYILLFSYILYSTRVFMLFTVLAPMVLAISTRFLKRYSESVFLLNLMRLFLLIIGFGGFLFFLRSQGEEFAKTANKYVAEASVQQDDFLNNESYGEKRYDLGTTDFSPFGMVRAAPIAILTAFYRPGIWEARSPLLLISGLETTLFIYLTFVFFFKGNFLNKIRLIRINEFLVFSLLFILILGFFAGFTSILFGVLVRIKAPLLPFFLITLSIRANLKEEELEVIEESKIEKLA